MPKEVLVISANANKVLKTEFVLRNYGIEEYQLANCINKGLPFECKTCGSVLYFDEVLERR